MYIEHIMQTTKLHNSYMHIQEQNGLDRKIKRIEVFSRQLF